MPEPATGLIPLILAVLLGWTGAVKTFSRGTARQAPKTVLARMLRSSERATAVLRATGAAELLLAAGLLAAPTHPAPGAATALLGAGFVGYLGYGRAAAPEASCGCSASEDAPVTWRSFARAAVVLAGGATAAVAQDTWWQPLQSQPLGSLALLAAAALVLTALSADLDRWWLLPLRRTRLRFLGHPLLGTSGGGQVPVAATVELLEHSLAWQAAQPVVRSGLLDHWEADGWRFLLYSGVHGSEAAARPVSVVFALDATAGRDTPGDPAVRVSCLDADTGRALPLEHPALSRRVLPMSG